MIVFVTDPKKVKFRLNELKTWRKNNKYPDHIISSAFCNAKLQGRASKPKNLKGYCQWICGKFVANKDIYCPYRFKKQIIGNGK